MSKVFVTFGNERFKESRNRIALEAENIKYFDKIVSYSEADLKSDTSFWEKHGAFIEANSRGYGYYIWKAHLIAKTLSGMKNGDILVYLDSGCTFNQRGFPRFLEYINLVNAHPSNMLTFHLTHLEKSWTKMDAVNLLLGDADKLNTSATADSLLNTLQVLSGIFIIKKAPNTVSFIDKWCQYSSVYHLINDAPSVVPNDPAFRENRHDQSILSLLVKLFNVQMIPDETYSFPNWDLKLPFWATRIRK